MNLQILDKRELLGREVTTFGDLENPLFLAKDVASWIDHNNVTLMVSNLEEDEKKLDYVIDSSGQRRKATFITEDGVYEVLMQSRKPIANQFKKKVKKMLKDLRLNRFNPYGNLSKELQAIIALDRKQQEVDKKVENVVAEFEDFRDNSPLFNIECDEISRSVRNVGVRILGGKKSEAYADKSLRAQIYTDIYKELKRQFGVTSYKAIKRGQLHRALEIIENYEAPIVLQEEIDLVNRQLALA